jgi:ribosomal protein L7Ae-like RNA K-turn-binding protein
VDSESASKEEPNCGKTVVMQQRRASNVKEMKTGTRNVIKSIEPGRLGVNK